MRTPGARWFLVGAASVAFGCSAGDPSPLGGKGAAGSAQQGSSDGGGESSANGMAGDLGLTAMGGSDSGQHACTNLQCQQTTCTAGDCKQKPCAAGSKTTVSGTVYDPAGRVPLYNVIVYVPNDKVAPLVPGATCDKCSASVINPVAAVLTDDKGHFVLDDVPVGSDIPIVLQVGKWRRQITVPSVAACTDTALTDRAITRLPRNKTEGDIPLIAISVGGADSMECLPLRMGIDAAEITTESGAGRIHLYSGHDDPANLKQKSIKTFDPLYGGAALTPSPTLWSSLDNLKKYDIVILSCEGSLIPEDKPTTARQALYDYESLGGRVFASHWHHLWFSQGPAPVPQIGTWRDNELAYGPHDPTIGTIDTSFPKGKAMASWLVNVGVSMTPGQITIHVPRDNINAVNPSMATQWITLQNPNANPQNTIEFLSYNAPLNAADDKICGRAVFNDLHVSIASGDQPGTPFPGGCVVGDLSDQEKALEFMLFDLSSCVRKDDQPPEPPAIIH